MLLFFIPDVAVVVVIVWWLNRMYSMQHYVIKFVSDNKTD